MTIYPATSGTPHAVPPAARPWYAHLYVQVLAAIVAGVLLGHFAPTTGEALKPLATPSSSS